MQYLITKLQYPRDITSFLDCVFEIYEIRGRVGSENGIKFSIRTNEQNHSTPHVHAEYGEHNISIEIANGNILAGNLPKKNQKIAVNWVLKNKDKLLNDWKNIAISRHHQRQCHDWILKTKEYCQWQKRTRRTKT